ncbi:PqqD family peptide modification chaperone [Leucobacter sp. CSA1]|uniref:PqqD family peptide modification chaperone n=1 Tax=Leucobacter chromiisoli TaxID=2796471 RepID=A0A934UVQ5_9MICO|nr:PqqD family protein [Leucobacter chromiisoli]MBK0419463.1 PqqD family peptide modification chaperone [Leucobacter chromiisoli]
MSDARWAVPDDVIWVDAEGATFVLDTRVRDPRPQRLDGGGILIWDLLTARPRTIDELVDEIAAATGAPESEIRGGTAPFLERMAHLGYVERR